MSILFVYNYFRWMRTMAWNYCFEDIVTISIISDPVNRINNKPALEEFLRKTSLGQEAYIKILELTFEAFMETVFLV